MANSYVKQTWADGDIITKEKLDHIEAGIAAVEGVKGDKGDKGDTGETGAAGAKGDKGDAGAAGAKGASVKSLVINVAGTAVSGTATLTDDTTVAITGTYSAS